MPPINLVLRGAVAALAAVALIPSLAHAQQQQYTVDFNWAPDQPTVAEKTVLRASTTAPDVDWDFDGDGHVDARGGVVEHQFTTAGTHRVTVIANWPAAVPHRSALPVALNGMLLTPQAGQQIELETTRTATTVRSNNARVTFPVKGGMVNAFTGKLDWKLAGDKLNGFKVANAQLGGMKIAAIAVPTLLPNNKAKLAATFALPANLGGTTASQPIQLETGAQTPVLFSVMHGSLPGLSLSSLTVRYDGAESWGIDAKAAMCGDLALTAGPNLLGAPALSLEGGFGLNLFESKPSTLKAYGKVKLVGMTLKDAEFEMRDTGYVGVRSKMELGWPGVATIKGSSSIEFQGTKFNGESTDQVCLEFIDYCLGSATLLSTKGIAACLKVDTWVGTWSPGFGAQWGKSAKLYWSGCDLAPYRETFATAAAAGDRTVRLPHGLPGAAIAVTGAPRILLTGPKGERIETVADRPITTEDFFVMPAPGVTQIAIRNPSAGTWKLKALEGTITGVKSAQGLPAPSIKAKVRKGKLTYTVKRIPGQVVRFTQGGRDLGRAKAKGTLRIKGKGPIPALVEQDGQLRDRVIVKR